MITSTENNVYQKLLKKGNGSILKAIRMDKGAGRGMIAAGIMFLVIALMLGLPVVAFAASKSMGLCVFGVLLVPSVLLIIPGIILKNKREHRLSEGAS